MPISYLIERDRGLLTTRGTGAMTFAEVVAHFQELERDPEFVEGLDLLLDFSDCTSVPSTEQLRDVSNRIGAPQSRLRFGRCAIVATEDALFGMTRMFLVFAEDSFDEREVFRGLAEAETWLERKRS